MAESSTTVINEKVSSEEVIKLKISNQTIPITHLKELINSFDARDKKKLNSIMKNIVVDGDTNALEVLVRCGYKLDILSQNGQTPLHLAFYNCNSYKIEKQFVNLLFTCASDKNFKDSIGLTHLHVACVFGNTEMVKKFIQNKEDINACFRYQLTPLHFAVMHHNLKIVQILLNNGAKVSSTDQIGRTPLHLAARVINDTMKSYCQNDDLEVLKCLLEHQFNIHMKDKEGNTPLLSIFQHFYADHEKIFIWNYSLESAKETENSAFVEITARQKEKLTIFLKAGAYVTGANKNGDTILHRIITSTAFMRQSGDLRDLSFDDTQHAEMVKQVLEVKQNYNINAKNQKGETPLQVAVCCLSSKIVEILLDHKADTKDLRLDYFHYVMVPNFECVQNFVSIIELLSNQGFKMTILHDLPILEFLIHNRDDCSCGELDQYYDIKDLLEVLVHFGSASHIKTIFKKIFRSSVVESMYTMEPLLSDILDYLNYIDFGNLFIEKKVHAVLERTLRKLNFCMLPFKPDNNEIEKMKVTELKSSVTLYEIMQKNPIDVYKYIETEDFTFLKDFPEYQIIIKGHLTKAITRNFVEKTSLAYLKAIFSLPMPHSYYKNILKYLSNEDMVNIVKAKLITILEIVNQS